MKRAILVILGAAIVLMALAGLGNNSININSLEQRLTKVEQYQNTLLTPEQLQVAMKGLSHQLALTALAVPDSIKFCDSVYVLRQTVLGERVRAELLSFLQRPGSAITLWQRMGRYFPLIESELKAQGLPDDLKYLVACESWLDPRVFSSQQAAGLMQLTKASAKDQKLVVNNYIDERLDPVKAIPAGLRHFNRDYQSFGDYLLAVAAYNMGGGALKSRIMAQGVADYLTLRLFRETERYFPSILALKIFNTDPKKYLPGITQVSQFDSYPQVAVKIVKLKKPASLRQLAVAANIAWGEFNFVNPQYLGHQLLPPGNYQVNVVK